VFKKIISQKAISPVGEGSLSSADDSNQPAYGDQPKSSINDYKKFMAEHSGKGVLSSDVEIKGAIKLQKELLIDGKVEGEINSDGVLTVGENGDIRAEIKTKSITIYGKVQGNIAVSERCELKSKCTLQGDLKAARLIMEEGATFIGKAEVSNGMSVKAACSRPEVVRHEEAFP